MNFSICTNRLTADDKAFYRNFRTVFWERCLKSGTKMFKNIRGQKDVKIQRFCTVSFLTTLISRKITEFIWMNLPEFSDLFKKISPGT